MTVEKLISELQNCNPDAKVLITVGNEDNDSLSTGDFEVWGENEPTKDYIELYVDEDSCRKQA